MPVLGDGAIQTVGTTTGIARQTYLSLACLPDDSFVIVYRQQPAGVDPDFGGASYDALSLQRRAPDGVWSDAVPLVCSANRVRYRMVLISKDDGATWDCASTADFLEGMAAAD